MRRVSVAARARADLADIIAFLSVDLESYRAARRFAAGVLAYCERLAANPALVGSLEADLGQDVRSVPHKSVTIYLRYERDRLRVLRIIPSRRDRSRLRVGD